MTIEKTIKIRAYPDENLGNASKSKLPDEKNNRLELANKDALLEEEKSRSLEHLKTIVQLRESLKNEQGKNSDLSKSAFELQAKLYKLSTSEDSQLVRINAQLEDEKKKSTELCKTIEQLTENLKQARYISSALEKKIVEQDAKATELAEMLRKISSIAAGV